MSDDLFLRIDVQWLTIAVHKEMILETLILCFKQQMLVFTQQQLSVLFTWLRLTTYLLIKRCHSLRYQKGKSNGNASVITTPMIICNGNPTFI